MTALDWIIVVFTLALASYGYLQGFIVGALSLVGFALGAVLGTRLGPALLPHGSASPYAPVFGLAGAVFAGGVLAAGFEGVGSVVRRVLRVPGLGLLDGVLGALLTGCVALGIAWIAGAAAVQAPGAARIRTEVQRSAILQKLNDLLPPSGPILHALARFDPLPSVRGPGANVPPPRGAIARDPQVRAAGRSTVRVLGTACGLGVEGSGWVAGGGLVVTNAHVVAGEDDTTVELGGTGARLDAVPVAFDPRNDVAVLLVRGLGGRGLRLAGAVGSGRAAAVLGYPENGPFRIRAARLGSTRRVLTQDAYGRGPVSREVTSFRGVVQHGNSGGPLVDDQGRVAGTVFAATSDARFRGGFAVPNSATRLALARGRARGARGRSVSTEECAS